MREAITHELRTWPQYFGSIMDGSKCFELRRDDRDFQIGDSLCLKEFDPETANYTGWEAVTKITYILKDAVHFGLSAGFVILGFDPKVISQFNEAAE